MGISSVGGAGKTGLASPSDAPNSASAEIAASNKTGFAESASRDSNAVADAPSSPADMGMQASASGSGSMPQKNVDLSSVFSALEKNDGGGNPAEEAKMTARASKAVLQRFTDTQKLVDKYKYDSHKGTNLKISV